MLWVTSTRSTVTRRASLPTADGLGGVDDAEIADPAVDDAVDLEAVEGLVGERDLSGWCDQTEVFDSNLRDLSGVFDFDDCRSVGAEIFRIVGIGERYIEDESACR